MGDEADVFISYKRSDRERVALIAEALDAQGISVWLDARLEAGEAFDVEITRHLRSAKAVLVCWSKASVESQWVRAEATEGRESGRLVAVMLEPCRPYPPFNLIHMEDLTSWRGQKEHAAFQRMIDTLARKANRQLPLQHAIVESTREKRSWPTLAIAAVLSVAVIGGGGYFARETWSNRDPAKVETELVADAEANAPPPTSSVPATTVTTPRTQPPATTQPAGNAITPPEPRRPMDRVSWGVGFDANGELETRHAEQTRSSVTRFGLENVVTYTVLYDSQDDTEVRQHRVEAIRAVLISAGVPANKIRARRYDGSTYAVESSFYLTCGNTSYPDTRRELGCND